MWGILEAGKKLRPWIDPLAHFAFPEVCQVCRSERAGPAEGYLCADCHAAVRFVEDPSCAKCGLPFEGSIDEVFTCANCREISLAFDHARSAVHANEFVRELIHRFKYGGERHFGTYLGELMNARAVPELAGGGWDGLVPVPLHPRKLREREFNQAEQLAKCLGRASGIPVFSRRLIRAFETETQTQLSRKARTANVKGAFQLAENRDETGRSLVLVDDVLTTGATTSACARVLKAAGAKRVMVWTVARATFAPSLI